MALAWRGLGTFRSRSRRGLPAGLPGDCSSWCRSSTRLLRVWAVVDLVPASLLSRTVAAGDDEAAAARVHDAARRGDGDGHAHHRARASVSESVDDLKARDMILCRFPEVDMVVGKAGRAETPTDPAPMDMIETMVNFRPREFWPRRKLHLADARDQVEAYSRRPRDGQADRPGRRRPRPRSLDP